VSVVYEASGFKETGSIACRAAGPVTLSEGETFSNYIVSALKEELSKAGKLSDDGKRISVIFNRIDFSSSMGATNWYIDAIYRISDKKIPISTVYHDRSSFVAVRACNYIALYFKKAVEAHLSELYNDQVFQSEVGYVAATNNMAPTIENRLRELKRLYESGLITEDEFNRKKAQLIDSL